MLGVNNYVIVVVINSLNGKPTDYFSQASTLSVAAFNSIKSGTTGDYHSRSDIQKQAYDPEMVKSVRGAFGITGTKFETHTPYISGQQVSLDQSITKNTEIVLINNNLAVKTALEFASRHAIIPWRRN